MVKNSPCNARDSDLVPGRGTKIPHATGKLSVCTESREVCVRPNKDPTQPKEKKNFIVFVALSEGRAGEVMGEKTWPFSRSEV